MIFIAERAKDPRLQALYDEGVNVYSFSKLGTINNCLYESWRTYILHDRGSGSVYTELGTASHQAVEDFIEGKIDKSGMLPIFEAGVEQCDMLRLQGRKFHPEPVFGRPKELLPDIHYAKGQIYD